MEESSEYGNATSEQTAAEDQEADDANEYL